jgi:hypothetical protein
MKVFALAASVTAAFLLLVLAATPNEANATAPRTKTTHLIFENCNGGTTLKVTLPRLTFKADQPVTFNVTISNPSATPCGPSPPVVGLVQGSSGLEVGPCGPVSMAIDNAKKADVYPGHVAIGCPAEFGLLLPAQGSLTATGTWDQKIPFGGSHKAPRGHYRLVIDNAVTFPITLTGG